MKEKSKKVRRRAPPARRASFLRRHPLLFYFLLALILFTALNVGLLLPLGTLSILYEIEHAIIKFFLLPVTFQRFEFIIIAIILLIAGYFIIPIVWIPSSGEWFIYTRTWTDGKLRYFKKLFGEYDIAFPEEWAEKKGLKWICLGRVTSREENDKLKVISYQSDNIEVTKALWEAEHVRALEEKIIQLEDALKKGAIVLPPEYAQLITEILARLRGEGGT